VKQVFLLGSSIAYSLSPAIHNAALRAMGLDWHYALRDLPVEALPEAAAYLRAEDCIGANVTIPHKEAIINCLDELGESARNVHAVNTIVKRNGRLIGENTDIVGFLQALRDVPFDPRGAHALILGAGGAARGVAFALGQAGAHRMTILNRTPSRAQALADDVVHHFPDLAIALNQTCDADLVVNTLPPSVPFDINTVKLARQAVVFDLTYRPAETNFMRQADAIGVQAVNGLGMLVYQAAASLELWTSRQAPVKAMFKAARQALE